jgi:hypothetical protein
MLCISKNLCFFGTSKQASFFMENANYPLPKRHANLMTQSEYNQVVKFAIAEIEKFGQIKTIDDGSISMDGDRKGQVYNLDNLMFRCKEYDVNEWKTIISDHFQRISRRNEAKSGFFLKDFEHGQKRIKLLVREPISTRTSELYRSDFSPLHSYLVLDDDESYQFLTDKSVVEWEQKEDDLFEIALENMSKETFKLERFEIGETKSEAFLISHPASAASIFIDLAQNLPDAVGEFGSVLFIPSRTMGIASPINDPMLLGSVIGTIYQLNVNFFEKDHNRLILDPFWYYRGRIYPFTQEEVEGGFRIGLPKKMIELFSTLADEEDDA